MNPWREEIPEDLSLPPKKWLHEHFDEYADWMTDTYDTYEKYYREHAAVPENPVVPKNRWKIAETGVF